MLTLGLTAVVDAQTSGDATALSGSIFIRLGADDRMELGFGPIREAGILPDQRFLPADVEPDTWLRTSPIFYQGADIGRIHVRRLTDGRTEFAFKPIDDERIFPRARHYPDRQSRWSRAHIDSWVRTSEIIIEITKTGKGKDDGSVQPPEPTVDEMEAAILAVLFGGKRAQANYNDWGCPDNEPPGGSCVGSYSRFNTSPNARGGYAGGHSGWDAQTISVAPPDMDAPDEPFYSLTNGEVIFVGDGTELTSENETRLIAVWTDDGTSGFVTRYLHAHSTCANLEVGDRVVIGQQLGIQGNAGVPGAVNKWDAEHVHVEMQTHRSHLYGYGAGSTNVARRTIDPVPTLYEQVAGWDGDFTTCDTSGTSTLIRVIGTDDVYVIQGNYRRLIVAGEIIERVPQWHWGDIENVTQAEMNRYEVSRLVRLPNDAGKVYLVVPVGMDSAVLRHIPDEATFDRAGCRWAAVYDITEQEASFSGYSKGAAMPSSGWSCR